MAQSQFALSWDDHKKNICCGLSNLQQNGEFVDMTLAADGHIVKVHQVIVALASPYIKELISSANCSHPIIFLNRISYKTLCAILEYIYTGEVIISPENLNELAEAGKALQIRGLIEMKMTEVSTKTEFQDQNSQDNLSTLDDEICYFEIANQKDSDDNVSNKYFNDTNTDNMEMMNVDSLNDSTDEMYEEHIDESSLLTPYSEVDVKPISAQTNMPVMQYTISNQGSLQMILNRFMYYLKHTNRNQSRQWRCVDYLNSIKCPAFLLTDQDDVVIKRIAAHTHPFHDKRILKKIRAGAVFSAIQAAQIEGNAKRKKTNHDEDTDSATIQIN